MKYDDINLELIRCFTTIAECSSFTEAGERLHKSQSAVSVRIKKLEDILGRQLLNRTSRSVGLSEDGKRFLPYATRLLKLNEEAVSVLQAPEMKGTLRLGVVEYFAAHRLPDLLSEIRRKFPAVDLQVKLALSSDLFKALDANEVDVIIAKTDPSRSGGIPILSEQLNWVHCMDDVDLSGSVPLCLMPEPCIYRLHALNALSSVGMQWQEVVSTASVFGLQSAIAAGLGIGAMGTSCVLPEMKRLDVTHGMPPLPQITLSLFGSHKEKTQLAEPVLNYLRVRVGEES